MTAVYFDPEFTDDELDRSSQGKLAVYTASSAGVGRHRRHYLLKLAKLRFTKQGAGFRFTALGYAIALTDWVPVKLGFKLGST